MTLNTIQEKLQDPNIVQEKKEVMMEMKDIEADPEEVTRAALVTEVQGILMIDIQDPEMMRETMSIENIKVNVAARKGFIGHPAEVIETDMRISIDMHLIEAGNTLVAHIAHLVIGH